MFLVISNDTSPYHRSELHDGTDQKPYRIRF
jgi:hypothetical protein